MQVSVKKKSSTEVNYTDVETPLPELVKREVSVPTPKVEVVAKPEVVEPPVAKPTPKITPKRPSILNLGDLLSKEEMATTTAPSQEGVSVAVSNIDEQSGEKLESAKGAIMNYLAEWRPRFIAVFEPMTISENIIKIAVPTTELKDEILRSKTELLTKIVELASIKGVVELDIEVNEAIKSFKPIKLEDRIAYIMELNPLIIELKEALDLDVEG